MKHFFRDLKKHAAKIISYEKNEMMPLTYEENQSYHEQNIFVIYAKKSLVLMIKNTIRSEIIVITLENIEALLIMFVI